MNSVIGVELATFCRPSKLLTIIPIRPDVLVPDEHRNEYRNDTIK